MTFLIAAAGTGGHVYPGLSVGQALLSEGVGRDEIHYVGGDRLEADVFPKEGFSFLQVELAGLRRSVTLQNVRIPSVVVRARKLIGDEIASRGIRVVLGMGGYVTIPAGMAARKHRVVFFNSEQNADAGLANRVSARWARASFVSFPSTGGLPGGEWVGNPVRQAFWSFDRTSFRSEALDHYDLDGSTPVLGVFGGSLGAGVINDAVATMVENWTGPPMAVVHLTGESHIEDLTRRESPAGVVWRRAGFEDRMDLFYAVSDVVVARAGGAVAELTATATPSILVPGSFGSGGHQERNAGALADAGAARVVPQDQISDLAEVVAAIVGDESVRDTMARATLALAKPEAARTIAQRMIEAAG